MFLPLCLCCCCRRRFLFLFFLLQLLQLLANYQCQQHFCMPGLCWPRPFSRADISHVCTGTVAAGCCWSLLIGFREHGCRAKPTLISTPSDNGLIGDVVPGQIGRLAAVQTKAISFAIFPSAPTGKCQATLSSHDPLKRTRGRVQTMRQIAHHPRHGTMVRKIKALYSVLAYIVKWREPFPTTYM